MFVGIDVGTSSVKLVVIDDKGLVCAQTSRALPISRPHPTWSEQDPHDWWGAAQNAVLDLAPEMRAKVQAIGLSGQMHGATLLGANDEILRPAILWNDGRSAAECIALQTSQPEFLTRGANLVMPGFTAPKLAWVRTHEPDIFAKVAKVLLPKDYVRFKMTGEFASDVSDSAGTLWMDVAQRQWHTPLLEACGLNTSHMPALFEGHEITGTLRADVAAAWGMTRVPVVAGGGDNAAGAIGAGVIANGDTLMSLGTSGVIFTACETYKSAPQSAVHAFCHAVPDTWHLMSVMLSAASCLEWACNATHTKSVAALLDLAETAGASSGCEIFLPYLSGERTPHNNPSAQGVLFGISHDTDSASVANAVLEGVAFGMADGCDALVAAGADITTLSVIGGGAKSLYWGRILASAIGRPLVYRDGAAVGPAFGAARLARFGLQGGVMADVFTPPEIETIIEPDSGLAETLATKRNGFKTLYQSLKPMFAEG